MLCFPRDWISTSRVPVANVSMLEVIKPANQHPPTALPHNRDSIEARTTLNHYDENRASQTKAPIPLSCTGS